MTALQKELQSRHRDAKKKEREHSEERERILESQAVDLVRKLTRTLPAMLRKSANQGSESCMVYQSGSCHIWGENEKTTRVARLLKAWAEKKGLHVEAKIPPGSIGNGYIMMSGWAKGVN